MSEAGPSLDRPPPPSTNPSTPKPLSSRHDQGSRPNDAQRTSISSPTDGTMTVEFPPRPHTVPERTTARHPDPPTTPLSALQPLSGTQAQTALLPQTTPENRPAGSPPQPRTTRGRLLAFFGFGAGPELRERKDLMSLIWNLGFNGLQITAIIALLIFSSEHASPEYPDVSEWRACDKPLGLWNSVWAVKVGFDCVVVFWGYRRERASRAMNTDVEARPLPAQPPDANPPGTGRVDTILLPPRGPSETPTRQSRNNARNNPDLPHSPLYSRLSVLLSILSFVWFIASNVFIYSSLDSCRISAPHLWWLTFSILTITYLMLLELLLLGLIVFVIGPIVYLVWNIFLMCIGQHPLQNPHAIKPEIGKLSKAAVEKIPLVLYIPTPEDQESGSIPKPSPAHTYPPTSPKPKQPRRRFFFLRKKKTGEPGSNEKGKAQGDSSARDNWEDNWEKGEYPFVRLEGNRAACAICLMDFDEPKRAGGHPGKDGNTEAKGAEDDPTQRDDELRLEDAGEGPQPLRLLACGHVFHKTCLDPWLTGVSGRCPVCQRPVEVQDSAVKKQRNTRT